MSDAARRNRPAPDEIEVSVLGPGTGESIVLHLPGLGWGVIDSCRDTAPYLDLQGVERLAFAGLTHPHADHYRGLDAVLRARRGAVERVWTWSGRAARELRTLQRLYNEHGRGDLHGLGAVFQEFAIAKQEGAATRTMSACKLMLSHTYAAPHGAVPVSVHALSPSESDEEAYVTILARALPRVGEVLEDLPDRAHNLVSAALLVVVGPWRICLGSDVEVGQGRDRGWRGIVADETRPSLRAHLLKVSHHGSEGAHLEAAWSEHADPATGLVEHAVVAPFAAQRLPRPRDLARLRGCARSLHVTARRSWMPPKRVYDRRQIKHVRKLKNWQVVDPRLGHVRYRCSLAPASRWRVERFGRADDVPAGSR